MKRWVVHRASVSEGAGVASVTARGPAGEVVTRTVPVLRCADCGALLPGHATPGAFIALDADGGWVSPETLDGFPGVRCGR